MQWYATPKHCASHGHPVPHFVTPQPCHLNDRKMLFFVVVRNFSSLQLKRDVETWYDTEAECNFAEREGSGEMIAQ